MAVLQTDCQGVEPPAVDRARLPEQGSAGVAHAGALIRTADYNIRVSTAEDCSTRERDPPPTGSRRVGVQVWLEPTGSVQVPANPYYARLVDGEGNVYEATLGGCGVPLRPPLPARGQPAQGWIVFEVPLSARDFTLTYAPELVGVAKYELAIELSTSAPRSN